MRILLVEDDGLLGEATRHTLVERGCVVDWVLNGLAADRMIPREKFDCIVLDLNLPELSGMAILENMRNRGDITPVIITSMRGSIEDRIAGLKAGADDYLVKPYDNRELLARLDALQRRVHSRAKLLLQHKSVILDPAAHTVSYNNEPIILPRREFALLQALLEHVGTVIAREHLTQALYGLSEEIDSNAVEVHIHHLRKHFGQSFIRTVRGIGYTIDD